MRSIFLLLKGQEILKSYSWEKRNKLLPLSTSAVCEILNSGMINDLYLTLVIVVKF
jgi:hypothetical protein